MMEQAEVPQAELLFNELSFTTSRSGGPGGQNVNKVNTKVTLKFDVVHSAILKEDQKNIIIQKLSAKITNGGILMITSQDKRSQLENKQDVILKLNKLLVSAFSVRKKRKATKPSKSSARKRVDEKKQRSQTKQWRQKPE